MNLLSAENSIVFEKLKAVEYLGFRCISKKDNLMVYKKSNKKVFIVFKLKYLRENEYNVQIFVDDSDYSPKKNLNVNEFLIILDALYERSLKRTVIDLFDDNTNKLFIKIGMDLVFEEKKSVVFITNRTKGNNYIILIQPLMINRFKFIFGNINDDGPELVALFSTARQFKKVLQMATERIEKIELD